MITVQLNGGIGNQLFQYAAGKSLSLFHKVPLQLDVSAYTRAGLNELEVPREFGLHAFTGINDEVVHLSKEANEKIIRFLKSRSLVKLVPNHKRKIYSEPFFHFDPNFFNSRKTTILRGLWQSEKYFASFRSHFVSALTFKAEMIKDCDLLANEMRAVNSVSVHIRRADYLRTQTILDWHGVMEKDYYLSAFQLLKQKIGDFKAFYFTDDIDWVRTELQSINEGRIVTGAATKTHFEDLYLMSQCKHNVIANSSFSWWGAWLNRDPAKVVVAPKKWFNNGPKDTQDLTPGDWVRL